MNRQDNTVAVVGSGFTAHVVASIVSERGFDVVIFAENSSTISAIWNGLGSIFGPAARMPAASDGAIGRRTAVASPFDATRAGRWSRLMERRSSVHPYARLELEQSQVSDLVDSALAHLPNNAIVRTPGGTVVPGPHGHPYAADLLAPSLTNLDLRDGQRVGAVTHPGLSGWNARSTALQIDRAAGLDAFVVGEGIFGEAPVGHSVRSARWFEEQWESGRDHLLESFEAVSRDSDLDLLILPPIIGPSLACHATIWETLDAELQVDVAEAPPEADPVFGWRLFQHLRRAATSRADSRGAEWRQAPDAEKVEIRNMKATSVTDESGTVHEVDALVLTGGRWFGDGLPKRPPLRERLTDAPIWLDGAILPDGSEVYPPDLLGKLPWDDHELFRMGLQIDSSGRVFDEEARPYTNIYAAGRLLAGFNPIHDGCSMGVSLVSGARVGREITDSREGEMSEPSSVEST